MDFMAPRALSPSFNKVKSKALSISQWARGTVDAAVFNPRDDTVHYMLGCSLIGGPSFRSSHLGTLKFLWQSRFIVAQMGIKTGHLGLCQQTETQIKVRGSDRERRCKQIRVKQYAQILYWLHKMSLLSAFASSMYCQHQFLPKVVCVIEMAYETRTT